MILEGRVVRSQSRSFSVETPSGRIVDAVVLKGLRSRHPGFVDPVAVGDRVKVRLGVGATATIEDVLPRRNRLSRPAVGREGLEQLIAANLSRVVIVQATAPPWKPATFDRYLVMASAGSIEPALCLNKIDLDPESVAAPELAAYRRLGIPVVVTSARTGEGMTRLKALLAGGVSVFVGPSGAGKSSLINALAPGSALPTGHLSRSTGKGRHTTTWVQMLSLGDGIEVADSPGLRVLGLWGVAADDLPYHFPEIAVLGGSCRFRRCTHVHEPDCRVRDAVAAGRVEGFRYESYRRILETLTGPGNGRARNRRN